MGRAWQQTLISASSRGTPEPVRRYADMMVLGKRHRTRQLMKFRNKRTARSFVVKDQEGVNQTKL